MHRSINALGRVNTINLEKKIHNATFAFLFTLVVTIKSLSKTLNIKILFGKAFTNVGNSYGYL